MAIHNHVRLVGYIKDPPIILNLGDEGAEKILLKLKTVHRDLDGYFGKKFQEIMVFYDSTEMIEKFKKLKQYDLIDIKGVLNILTVNKKTQCKCGAYNIKYGSSAAYVYPISMHKLNAVKEAYEHDKDLPERILEKHFKEISNESFIVGTVVNEPKLYGQNNRVYCKYQIGIDRKYYIKTQGELTSDYPWVYSFGKQALMDIDHLKVGSVILADGFIQSRSIMAKMDDPPCQACGKTYTYPSTLTEIVPYSVEYLRNYITDEEIAENAEKKKENI